MHNKTRHSSVISDIKALSLLLFIVFFVGVPAQATPRQIILIRHAEKKNDHDNDLSKRGQARARALVDFFKNRPEVTKAGLPVALYAMKPKDSSGSIRAIQTLLPTAQDLGLPVIADYKKDDIKDLVAEILESPKYDGKNVVVCWEHKVLVDIAHALGARKLPPSLGTDVFDRAWVLNYTSSGNFLTIEDIAQRLLPGDSAR